MSPTATDLLDSPEVSTDQAQGELSTAPGDATEVSEIIAADLLVEEISIDGMCGVY